MSASAKEPCSGDRCLRRSSMFYIRRDDPRCCPNCGQRVTPYAAGCSLCGLTLDPQRWQRRPGPLERVTARWRELLASRRR